MIVTFISQTRFGGKARFVGDKVDVDNATAIRLADSGIVSIDDVVEEIESETNEDTQDYNSMSSKALYNLCIERGIEVEAKQPKDVYINALSVS